ncbi:ROK family transcriptional regulator [Kineosporia sp. NBRC 101731]|uniref:ROK family transcriptional regulator n=1 Tax=Kineosporia sp. NBRC 101731 TaxID=3032199 RepID=UPI0024A35539|nr:ROK family transcriptional regulator [Kineosporia sp. NBRC 101731]GLY30033.1 xylose repressor [Kineosporia sp. NBRC 101731]
MIGTRASELLRVVHENPDITRADAARTVGIGTGAATELVARLTAAELISERPAGPAGRGRPTTVLQPHPRGPLVLAVAFAHETWRAEVVQLGGQVVACDGDEQMAGAYGDGERILHEVQGRLTKLRRRFRGRIRGMGVSVPGLVAMDRLIEASTLGWSGLDLNVLWPKAPVMAVGNDATFAASAESRRGAAVGAAVALHIRVDAGLGGALVESGRVLTGAVGLGGEFGHVPFAGDDVECPCGARGCWGASLDGFALARLLGQPVPADPVSYARRVVASGGRTERQAVELVAGRLGRGIAGLVNAVDPELVTVGGLGVDYLNAASRALDDAYLAGLMAFRRADPPPVLAAQLLEGGPVAGAAEEAWTRLWPLLPT